PRLTPYFYFTDTLTPELYTLSLHDALPISPAGGANNCRNPGVLAPNDAEAILDAEYASAVAPSAAIELVSCADTRIASASLGARDRKSTRLNSSHVSISYAVFCLKKKKKMI